MTFESSYTLIGSVGILLIGFRVFLLDKDKLLNRLFLLMTASISWMMFCTYELTQTTDPHVALGFRKLMSFWPFHIYLIGYCLFLFGKKAIYPKMPSVFWNALWGLLALLGIFLIFRDLDIKTMHSRTLFLKKGSWLWYIPSLIIYDYLRLGYLLVLFFIAALSPYLSFKHSNDKNRKRHLFIVFIVMFLSGIITITGSWVLPALQIPTPTNQVISSFFSVLFFAWTFTDFKLFEVKPEIAVDNIVESMTNLMVLTNEFLQIQRINPAAADFFKLDKEKCLNHPFDEVLEFEDWRPLRGLQSRKDKLQREVIFEKEGIKQYVLMVVTPIFNAGNKKIGYSFIGTDLTPYKEAELKIQKHIEALEKSNTTLERFAYITSHDLKEPIRTIGSFASLIRRKYEFSDEVNEYLNFINQNVNRMYETIDSILNISLLQRQKTILKEVEPTQILQEVQESLAKIITDKNAKISFGDFPKIKGDKTQLKLLFQNLVENGLKYNHNPNPTIEIQYFTNRDCHEFSVKDNGIGIAEDYHDKIFEMFKTLHSRGTYEGSGIGLSICEKIVDFHGGRIWVDSNEGDGADFRFTIPKN